MSDNLPDSVDSNILIYQSDSGETRLEVRLQDETVWLSQKMMAQLFQKDVRTINHHIQSIYEEGELEPSPTIRKFRIVQTEGNRQVSRLVHGWMSIQDFERLSPRVSRRTLQRDLKAMVDNDLIIEKASSPTDPTKIYILVGKLSG
jgi:hypothetical protein